MMEVIACMGKYDQNQSMCAKEVASFDNCYKDFMTKNLEKSKNAGELPTGDRARFTGEQMNGYMKKFAAGPRKGSYLPDSAYNDMWKYKKTT